jgi:hypothetical protein
VVPFIGIASVEYRSVQSANKPDKNFLHFVVASPWPAGYECMVLTQRAHTAKATAKR